MANWLLDKDVVRQGEMQEGDCCWSPSCPGVEWNSTTLILI